MNDPILNGSLVGPKEFPQLSGRKVAEMSRRYFLSAEGHRRNQRFRGRAPAVTLETTLRGPNGEQQYEVRGQN